MDAKVGVVVPCFKVATQIMAVVAKIGDEVSKIYVVDDCCPQQTGEYVQTQVSDKRVVVLRHTTNQGVGAAVVSGYRQALADGMDIIVKLDGDGQMDPALIPSFIRPIINGRADYTKGNRFFSLDLLGQMPAVRLFGNAMLSFVSKAASGYWNVMDPTNGFTAIHRTVLAMLPLEKISKRYFFESDMLFRLNTIRAVVLDVPMAATYSGETSSLSIPGVLWRFPAKYGIRFFKRIFYNYFLRDFNMCSVQLLSGSFLLAGGIGFGAYHWHLSSLTASATPVGTVMLAALPTIIGFQLLLSALTFDSMNIPKEPLHSAIDAI